MAFNWHDDASDSLDPNRAWCINCHAVIIPVKVDPKVKQWRCRCEKCFDGAPDARNRTGWGDSYCAALRDFEES